MNNRKILRCLSTDRLPHGSFTVGKTYPVLEEIRRGPKHGYRIRDNRNMSCSVMGVGPGAHFEFVSETGQTLKTDVVNSPSHYAFFDGIEAIDIIARSMTMEQFKGYCLGNRLKYRLRAGNKDKLEQDIAKSDKYLELFDKHKDKCIDGGY